MQHATAGAAGLMVRALALRDALKGHYAGGAWYPGTGAEFHHVHAADRDLCSIVRLASAADMHAAITAANAAQSQWRHIGSAERTALLMRFASLVEAHGEELALLQTLDTGLPIAMARGLAPKIAQWTRYYAGWIDKIAGDSHQPSPGGRWFVNREPYGTVGVMLPWNMPTSGMGMKAMAALAAGNCVVARAPEVAPFGAMYLAALFEDAGFPPGVVNILPAGPEGGEALAADPRIAKLSFTGGAATAAKVIAASAPNITPGVFELGGKSACIVFEDADIDRVVPMMCAVALAASGQVCISPSRLLVHRSRYEEAVARAAAFFQTMELGDPFDPATRMGPVLGEQAAGRIIAVIERAQREDAGRLITGGGRAGGGRAAGAYVLPTLFADVHPDSRLFREEIFGPVVAMTPFADEADAIGLANGTDFGLYTYVFTPDMARALRVADRMESGTVAINGVAGPSPVAPFGGFRRSGHGKEGGREGLDEFLRAKTLFIADG